MRVRQDNRVDLRNRYGQGSVLLLGVDPLPLKHATVEENRFAIDAKDMTRARDLAGCSKNSIPRGTLRLLRCLEQDNEALIRDMSAGSHSPASMSDGGQRIFVLTCVPGQLDHHCLVFLHAGMK